MKLVMKFGGTSLASGEKIRHVCGLVKDIFEKGNRLVVVVSAIDDTTDELLGACEKARRGDLNFIGRFIEKISSKHSEALTCVRNAKLRKEAESRTSQTISRLENVLKGIAYLREVTPKVRDYALSFGECLSASIVQECMSDLGLRARWFTGKEAGIVTDSNFGSARPLTNTTLFLLAERLGPVLGEEVIPVVTGFIAADQSGEITTLGRGGSDYTATLIGAALKSDEVWIWSDVDGLMTADPKIEKDAEVIPELSFSEAVEMAYFGAKMMHPQALEVAMLHNIPVRIRNTFKPEAPGTVIVKNRKIEPKSIVKAISLIRKAAVITVSGASMVGAPGIAAKVFEILGKSNVNVLMVSQGSSEANISFVIPREALDRVLRSLEMTLLGGDLVREITVEDDVCIVALVGAGMKGTPGVAAKIFTAVANQGINVRMIAQGSSELNVSFVVKEHDGEATVRALHREFRLSGS